MTYNCDELADDNQREVYKKFPNSHFLCNKKNAEHFYLWNTFLRRNLHRVAIDYLGLNLHWYQILMLFLMGRSQFICVVASRACAKSFVIAVYACCRCIIYPYTKFIIASGTKGQAKLIVTEKIKNELMSMSPMLRKEIEDIKDGQNEIIVKFRNNSTIRVVASGEQSRGFRSNVVIREEFRQIEKNIDDSILSPFQTIRQAPYALISPYKDMKELQEEPVDIYISSSWTDNGHWMWEIVDNAYKDMMSDKNSCLLAFDEAITLKHNIKTQKQLQKEKRKQDPLTWRIEFLNERVKENTHAFFSFKLLNQNQKLQSAWYPRTLLDVKNKRKNPYAIPKEKDEIRIVSCDMAFVVNKKNDNSIFSCIRLVPENQVYESENGRLEVKRGYRRMLPYLEPIQGGNVLHQARRIRQLYEDFEADYIVLDFRNGGSAIYDLLASPMYDEERGIEYTPLKCMNDDNVANRIQITGAKECIFVINATQKLNSDIALAFRSALEDKRFELLVPYQVAKEEIFPTIKEYTDDPDGDTQAFIEAPYIETQMLISETTDLVYEKKEQTGVIAISEQGNNRKDRYTSVSYGNYFADLLQNEYLSGSGGEYEYGVFTN